MKRDHPTDSSEIPVFSLEEALTLQPGEITPENFLQIAKAEMKKVFGRKPEIEKDTKIPVREEEDSERRIRRNLILMQRYLKDQIDHQANPERIQADLIAIDRFLNAYLLSLHLDAEDAYRELTDYFEGYLMKLEALAPFTPQFGALARFYTWLGSEPSLQNEINYVNIAVPRACETLLLIFRNDIPYLTRLYEIASDPANDRIGSLSCKTDEEESGQSSDEAKESLAEIRVSNWRKSQRNQNRQIVSRFYRDLLKDPDWSRPEIEHAVEIADLYLINTLPKLLLRADQSAYDLRSTLRKTRRALIKSGRTEDSILFENAFSALITTLTNLGFVHFETSATPLDPYSPKRLSRTKYQPESLAPSWQMDQVPDSFEDTLKWLKWNIDRNERFLLAFQMDLEDSGMDADQITEHVDSVQALMGELLRYEGRTMETLPKGLNDLLTLSQDYYDFVKDQEMLLRFVDSLRRFYRSMVRQGYLSTETGEELLSYLKRKAPDWIEHIGE